MVEQNDPKETSVTIQDVEQETHKNDKDVSSWTAQEGQLLIPASNLNLLSGMQSTGISMDVFVRGVGVGLLQGSGYPH